MLDGVANAHERGVQVRLDMDAHKFCASELIRVMSTREIGAAWLDLLNGKDSPLEEFVARVKIYAPRNRLKGKLWEETRQRVFERDGYRCVYCGSEDQLECDHVLAIANGGGHEFSNLATACKSCNSRKNAKLIEEWSRG